MARNRPQVLIKADVRFGSKADISQCNRHVRFTPESGHWSVLSSAILVLQY